MYDVFDLFSPKVYVVSDKMYTEYKDRQLEKQREALRQDIEYHQKCILKLEERLEKLSTT